MRTRIERDYVDYGCGFSVIVDAVEVAELGGEKMMRIEFDELERQVLRRLIEKPGRLTGAEVRFIRLHFDMTLEAFGKRLGVSHVAAHKWETKQDSPTGMHWAEEKSLRLLVLRLMNGAPDEFIDTFDRLEAKRPVSTEPLRISLSATPSSHSARASCNAIAGKPAAPKKNLLVAGRGRA